jgi:uncharacterized protein YjiS (DUF1127 family)
MIATTSTETFQRSFGLARAAGVLRAACETVRLWHALGRQRRHLAGLDDRMLRDIGITRADVQRECHYRFWPA